VNLKLNLATHPFGRARLFWFLTGTAAAVLIVAAIGMMVFYAQGYEMDPELVQRENDFRAELRKLQLEEARYRSALAEDKNAQVLARSLFLNQLLVRKGISWTRTFADLEEIFPPRVRMIQVRPELDAENKVLLEMIVGAETRPDFIELLIALEKSSAFGNPDVRGSSPPTDNDPAFKYSLMVSYEQRL